MNGIINESCREIFRRISWSFYIHSIRYLIIKLTAFFEKKKKRVTKNMTLELE